MVYLLLTLYSLLFIWFANRHFKPALGLFILLLPTYLIRFSIGPLPSTMLELTFGIIFLVWLIKHAQSDWPTIQSSLSNNKLFFCFLALFFTASSISIFVGSTLVASLGQWRAYFLEPLILFFIILGQKERVTTTDLIWWLGLSTLSISTFAIFQQCTGWGIATPEWTAPATRRVTSFFSSPNAVGLYLAPILPLMIYASLKQRRRFFNFYSLIFILSLTVIAFTKSVGTLLGLTLGFAVFFWLLGYKKIVATVVIIGCLLLPTYYTLLSTKSQSTTNRFILWSYSADFLLASPKNFIFGSGIRQFYWKIQAPHRTTNVLEPLLYPHNIFLNFWTETGLLGMLSFTGILYLLLAAAYSLYKNQDRILGAGLMAALIALIAHGLIDVPYFKNDLAMLFWILAALIIISNSRSRHLFF